MLDHPVQPRYFPDQPDVLDLGGRQKLLHSPYISEWWQDYGDYDAQLRLIVPAGFIYNGASVPQIVWSFYPPHPLDRAAVFHDFIYRTKGDLPPGSYQWRYASDEDWRNHVPERMRWTRNAADTAFYHHLGEDPKGPGWFSRQAAYRAVRLFGGSRWG